MGSGNIPDSRGSRVHGSGIGNRPLGGAVGNIYGGHGGAASNAPAVGGGAAGHGHKPPPSGYKYGNAG